MIIYNLTIVDILAGPQVDRKKVRNLEHVQEKSSIPFWKMIHPEARHRKPCLEDYLEFPLLIGRIQNLFVRGSILLPGR